MVRDQAESWETPVDDNVLRWKKELGRAWQRPMYYLFRQDAFKLHDFGENEIVAALIIIIVAIIPISAVVAFCVNHALAALLDDD